MKKFWVKVIPYNKNTVTTALESGADAVLVPEGFHRQVRELGLIRTISKDGDIKPGRDVLEISINSKSDEIRAAELGKGKYLIVRTGSWKVIPLENLLAQRDKVIAEVKNTQEAGLALGILEKGTDGILLDPSSPDEIKKVSAMIKSGSETIKLGKFRISGIKSVGMGDRVCVDTCTNMKAGEGMLVGNTSGGFFLVHSESIENPYVAARPFRVNAGGVHAYVRVTEGRTKYLSDLKSGDAVLVVDHRGRTQPGITGRIKVEKRPMVLVSAGAGRQKISLVMQNAETIRLTKPGGKPVSVVKLKKGDEVLGHAGSSGRHFGMKISETILEK